MVNLSGSDGIQAVPLILLILAPAATFAAAAIAVWSGRGKEVRDMRRRAYVEWVQVTGRLALVSPEDLRRGSVTVPSLEAVVKMNDLIAELVIVSSRRVLVAARALRNRVRTDEFGRAFVSEVGQLKAIEDGRQLLEIQGRLLEMERAAVIREMRKDMFPWWRRRKFESELDDDPQPTSVSATVPRI